VIITLAAVPSFAGERHIVISIPDRKLALMEDDTVLRVFDIAVGTPSTPTPSGEFQIVNQIPNPTWYHAGKVVPPGKQNPLGSRWMGLSAAGYGIHGTNAPASIGTAASHGCIRMHNRDVEQLFQMVTTGTKVQLRGEKTETAAE
jgi:L,D-transpeptidase ErfK/SrfK